MKNSINAKLVYTGKGKPNLDIDDACEGCKEHGLKNAKELNESYAKRILELTKLLAECQAYLIEQEAKQPSNRHDERPNLIARIGRVMG